MESFGWTSIISLINSNPFIFVASFEMAGKDSMRKLKLSKLATLGSQEKTLSEDLIIQTVTKTINLVLL
jgi:hypothetical protein